MLLIFPLTGVDFLSWSQISSPSCYLVCLQQLSCLGAVTNRVSLNHAGAGAGDLPNPTGLVVGQ